MFVVRSGFAGIMMFPLGGGFSAGQQMVMQGAMWGVGMAKALYANAIQAVGPDAAVIAQPMIPGTETIIAGLIDNELCMDLVNLASNTAGANAPLVPTPTGAHRQRQCGSGYVTWRYWLSTGNESGDPACGTVTVRESGQNAMHKCRRRHRRHGGRSAGRPDQRAQWLIRSQVASRRAKPLAEQNEPRLAHPAARVSSTTAVNDYTSELTTAATSIQGAINAAMQGNATQARNGNLNLLDRRGAAIDPRVDGRRRLLSRNRQVECVHSLPDERDPCHHVTDLPGPGSRPLL